MDYPFQLTEIRDEAVPQRDGLTLLHFKRVTFFLGQFGPFVERLPIETWATELDARVRTLQRELQHLPH